jgi:membrane-bound ClpP family serine protease
MSSAAQEVHLWQLLTRVRGMRVRRRLRALAEARRRERKAAAAVVEQATALERHAAGRQHVLAFCRRDQRAGGQWHATLRAHDGQTPMLQQQLSDAQHAQAMARQDAAEALRDWNVERVRYDDAKQRWRAALARVVRESREHG